MNDNIVTSDLADFGWRELSMAKDLLTALVERNNNKLLTDSGLRICMNPNSGYVFLSDLDHNTAMECDGELLDWINTPYEGREGFIADLMEEYSDMHPEDQEYMYSINETS